MTTARYPRNWLSSARFFRTSRAMKSDRRLVGNPTLGEEKFQKYTSGKLWGGRVKKSKFQGYLVIFKLYKVRRKKWSELKNSGERISSVFSEGKHTFFFLYQNEKRNLEENNFIVCDPIPN